MYAKFFKRFFDIICSFLGLLVLCIPMLIIAIIVKCDSKGPAMFVSERVGRNGKLFTFRKFRSMYTEAPKDCAPSLLDSDKYITRVGKILRKTSLDELPQLLCILKGDMSIIGPRPSGQSETQLNELRDKLGASAVRPGLTGLAQVSGRDVLAANVEKKAELDAEYAAKITFVKDAKIFFLTIKKVLSGDGIVEGTKAAEMANETILSAEPIITDAPEQEVILSGTGAFVDAVAQESEIIYEPSHTAEVVRAVESALEEQEAAEQTAADTDEKKVG